jgi:hypothetical protein
MRVIRAEPSRNYHLRREQSGWIDKLFHKSEHEQPNFNRRMFDEDFARLFRSLNHRKENLFDVVSNDDALTQRLLANIGTRYRSQRIDENIHRWVEEIAQSLIRFGTAHYFLSEDSQNGDIHINWFSSRGIFRLFGTCFQWVPKRVERNWDRGDRIIPREIRILDRQKMMRFVMPAAVKRTLSAQSRTFAVIDKYQFTLGRFHPRATHENPNPTNYFDFNVWRNTMDRVFYRSTLGTGWHGRKYDSSKGSEFFSCHRMIRFRRNQLKLRDEIFRQLSTELSRVGKGFNPEFKLVLAGTAELPSVDHLNELEARLSREDVGFSEIIDYCLKR